MIYEYRAYDAVPGARHRLLERIDAAHPLFLKHGMTAVGFWTPSVGDYNNKVIYIVAHENEAAREKSWTAFQADPEWQKHRELNEKDGPLVHRIINSLLVPTNFSPLK